MPTEDIDAKLREYFVELVSEPSAENYRRAWEAATALPDYNPYGSELKNIEKLLAGGKFQEAREACYGAMGSWLLSPRMHWLAAYAAGKLGDERTAQMESMFAAALVAAIQTTGDASEASPWLVTCTADEYDIAETLEKKVTRQTLLKKDQRVIDRIDCEDGTALHFDITRAYDQLGKLMVAGDRHQE